MDEIFKNTAYKIYEFFMENPKQLFSSRQVAKELGVTHTTVGRYVVELYELRLLKRHRASYYLYSLNRKSEKFYEYMRMKTIFEYEAKPQHKAHKGRKGYIM